MIDLHFLTEGGHLPRVAYKLPDGGAVVYYLPAPFLRPENRGKALTPTTGEDTNNIVRLSADGKLVWRVVCEPPVWTLRPLPPRDGPSYDPTNGTPLGPCFDWLRLASKVEEYSPNERYLTLGGLEVEEGKVWELAVGQGQTLVLEPREEGLPAFLIASSYEWRFWIDVDRGVAEAIRFDR